LSESSFPELLIKGNFRVELLEHLEPEIILRNQQVAGSIPAGGPSVFKQLAFTLQKRFSIEVSGKGCGLLRRNSDSESDSIGATQADFAENPAIAPNSESTTLR